MAESKKMSIFVVQSTMPLSMSRKSNHNIRVTFRVSQEEYDMYLKLAKRKGFRNVSSVIRNLLQCRNTILKKILREQRMTPTDIGDEIHQMFRNYEDDGRKNAYPLDINRRT